MPRAAELTSSEHQPSTVRPDTGRTALGTSSRVPDDGSCEAPCPTIERAGLLCRHGGVHHDAKDLVGGHHPRHRTGDARPHDDRDADHSSIEHRSPIVDERPTDDDVHDSPPDHDDALARIGGTVVRDRSGRS